MKRITEEIKNNNVNLLDKEISAEEISRQLHISSATVRRVRKNVRPGIKKSKGGRPTKLSEATVRLISRSILSGTVNTTIEMANQLRNSGIADIKPITVRRALRKSGLVARTKIKKPRLLNRHKNLRYEFAKKYKDWTVEDWNRVVWSDETKINRLGSDGCKWGWKKKEKKGLTDREVKGTIKFGGGSMMVWGCFTAKGVGYLTKIDGGLNAQLYVSILNDELLETLNYYGYDKTNIVFQQDNDPKHTSRLANNWFEENEVEVLEWPPQSPDLNPIEHMWVELKRRLNLYLEEPNSMHQLWERVQDTWNNIPIEICSNLIESMPSRIDAVLKSRGGYTKY